jgi:hypothetical protein
MLVSCMGRELLVSLRRILLLLRRRSQGCGLSSMCLFLNSNMDRRLSLTGHANLDESSYRMWGEAPGGIGRTIERAVCDRADQLTHDRTTPQKQPLSLNMGPGLDQTRWTRSNAGAGPRSLVSTHRAYLWSPHQPRGRSHPPSDTRWLTVTGHA